MAKYVKKVFVAEQISDNISLRGKKISGVLKLTKEMQSSTAQIFLTNVDRGRVGALHVSLKIGTKNFDFALRGTNEQTFEIENISQGDLVDCVVYSDGIAVVYFGNGEGFVSQPSFEQMVQDQWQADREQEKKEQNQVKQEQDIVSQFAQQSRESFCDIEALSQECEGNYYASKKQLVQQLFKTYPPCVRLNQKFRNTFWVCVPFSSKYFVVGVVTEANRVKYIGYGVPAQNGKKPEDESFTYTELSKHEGFWLIFQDAQSGQQEKGFVLGGRQKQEQTSRKQQEIHP